MNPREALESILVEEEKRIRQSFKSNEVVYPLIEIIRSLDYHNIILTSDSTPKVELLERYKLGWSKAYSIFFSENELTENIPFFVFEEEGKSWINSIIQHCGSIQSCKQLLNYQKANLLNLKAYETTFKFTHVVEKRNVEYYDRISLGYYFEIMDKVLKPESSKLYESSQTSYALYKS